MPKHNSFTGIAIALAWPQTYCKQPGSWYDGITNFFKISKNRFYHVGHAALVLVNAETRKCHYFDFGRYHSPFQYGRVRSETTDPGLKIETPAILSEDGLRIENFNEILTELQSNDECHGAGDLHAAYCPVSFERSFNKASQLQADSPIPYGPFINSGTNCSRFVCTSILAGGPAFNLAFRLKYLVITPTPQNNVNTLKYKVIVPKPFHQPVVCPALFEDKSLLKITLPEPGRHENIPDNAQWLSGEGAGSWFSMEENQNGYRITRFNDAGETECRALFRETGSRPVFNINLPYHFMHLSHCQMVTIGQESQKIKFVRMEDELNKLFPMV